MNTDRKTQSKNIELFLRFVNSGKIDAMSVTELTVFVMGYFDLIEAFSDKMPFLKDLSKKRQDAIIMINSTNQTEADELKFVFSQLQKKVRAQFEAVMKAVKEGEGGKAVVVDSKVTQQVLADLDGDKFASVFVPEKVSDKLDVESELKHLDIVIESILVGYGKKPSQLGVCEKVGCSNLFFKFSAVSKYCSTKCSNAMQQKNYRQIHKGT